MGKKNRNKINNKEECHIPRDMREIAIKIAKTISKYDHPKSKDVNQAREIKESCKDCKNCVAEQGHRRSMALINRYIEMAN